MKWFVFPALILLGACSGTGDPEQAESWEVIIKLLEATEVPTLREIRPYRDALVGHRYQILAWTGDREPPVPIGGEIALYHWAIVDGKPTAAAGLKPGDVERLEIQRMSDRPDLKGRYRKNSLDAFDLQEFSAVKVPVGREDSD